MAEARVLRKIADNVCVKVPLTPDGLRACRHLSEDGTIVNVTLCFFAAQALLAAKSCAAASSASRDIRPQPTTSD
jgi:transaldolase